MSNFPLFVVSGTHFEVGYQIGSTYRSLIHRYYENHPWLDQLEEYYATEQGRAVVEGFWAVCQRRFPHYIEELKGLASGSGIDFLQVQLLHLERELTTRLGIYQKTLVEAALGCTDILVNSTSQRVIGHNEDWHSQLSGGDILVYANIQEYSTLDGQQFPAETFLVHMWPGLLPGSTFGVNSHGYVFSVDQLFPNVSLDNKTPESFLCRHLLTSQNSQDTLSLAKDEGTGAALGFSLNFGFLDERELWNLETAPLAEHPRSKVDAHCVEQTERPSVYTHFNNYKRIMDPALVIPLCQERELISAGFDSLHDVMSVRAALGDTAGQFPIYQDIEADLRWATLASVVLDLDRKEMHIFRKNPKSHDPLIRIPFNILPLSRLSVQVGR